MALWLLRAGKFGENEQRFLQTSRVYATWEALDRDLGKVKDRQELRAILQEVYPDISKGAAINYSGQLWSFAHEMRPGDWLVLPLKSKPAIAVGEIAGPYEFDAKAEDAYFHSRKVKWINTEVPRSVFDQDLLYSFGAFMTICQIERNEAETRVRALASSGWKSRVSPEEERVRPGEGPVGSEIVDLERLGRDQIAKVIGRKFKGHAMARLVEGVLRAQGYITWTSPEGPDKGIDILAAPGPLGFGTPRMCVQVKSGDAPVDHPTLSQLIGTMQSVQAELGLLVSWGGFKASVEKETSHHFFRVRLWDQDALIEQLLEHYDRLDPELRAELPLKRVWTVAAQEEEG